jgi:hypothetical protein
LSHAEDPSEADAPAAWQGASKADDRDPSRISVEAYRELFSRAFDLAYPSHKVGEASGPDGAAVAHVVEVREPAQDPGFVVVTNGFGRVAQPRGDSVALPHVELVTWVEADSALIVSLVGHIGRAVHERGPSATPFKPGDTLRAPVAQLSLAGFVLNDAGYVPMPAGAPINLLELVPLNDADYADAKNAGTAWLEASYADPHARRRIRARWRAS